MRHQTTRHLLMLVKYTVALTGLAALSACGARSSAATIDSVIAASTTPQAITSTRSGTSRSAAGVAIDRRIVTGAQLRPSDFPSGWTSSPRPAATTGGKCPSLRGAEAAVSAHARSREFVQGNATLAAATADSAAYIYADTAGAEHWFARLSSRSTTDCIARVLKKGTEAQVRAQGGTLISVTASPMKIAPAGDQRAAGRIVIRLTVGGFHGKVEADLVYVRVGRGLAAFALSRVAGPFDHTLETGLVQAVTGRLAAGLDGAP